MKSNIGSHEVWWQYKCMYSGTLEQCLEFKARYKLDDAIIYRLSADVV